MNLDTFDPSDEKFDLFDFIAYLRFKTAASAGFDLGMPHPTPEGHTEIAGQLTIHTPCTGPVVTHLFVHLWGARELVGLPEQERFLRCRAMMFRTFERLALTADELYSYRATFSFSPDCFVIAHDPHAF